MTPTTIIKRTMEGHEIGRELLTDTVEVYVDCGESVVVARQDRRSTVWTYEELDQDKSWIARDFYRDKPVPKQLLVHQVIEMLQQFDQMAAVRVLVGNNDYAISYIRPERPYGLDAHKSPTACIGAMIPVPGRK